MSSMQAATLSLAVCKRRASRRFSREQFTINQQGQAFLKGEGLEIWLLELVCQRFSHTKEFESLQGV